MARLNVYVMWFLPAVLLWMCIDVEVKANNQKDSRATRNVCRLKLSDVNHRNLWNPFNGSLERVYEEINCSRCYSLKNSRVWKACKEDLRGSSNKMLQYDHLWKFREALGIAWDKNDNNIINLTNLILTLTDLVNSPIWTPHNCTEKNISDPCKGNLTEANVDYRKEILQSVIEMAMGTKTGRNRCQSRRRNKCQRSSKPRKGHRKNKPRNITGRRSNQTSTTKKSRRV